MFKLIRAGELSKEHFEEYPVWSEYYDYEEFDEIVSWGIDKDWLEKELDDKHDGSAHCVYTVLQTSPLPDRMRIFIKAAFRTYGGAELTGYVMNEDAYYVHIFCGDKDFFFNRHRDLLKLHEEGKKKLQAAIKNTEDEIFPLHYRTDFYDSEGKRIEGYFDYEGRA